MPKTKHSTPESAVVAYIGQHVLKQIRRIAYDVGYQAGRQYYWDLRFAEGWMDGSRLGMPRRALEEMEPEPDIYREMYSDASDIDNLYE